MEEASKHKSSSARAETSSSNRSNCARGETGQSHQSSSSSFSLSFSFFSFFFSNFNFHFSLPIGTYAVVLLSTPLPPATGAIMNCTAPPDGQLLRQWPMLRSPLPPNQPHPSRIPSHPLQTPLFTHHILLPLPFPFSCPTCPFCTFQSLVFSLGPWVHSTQSPGSSPRFLAPRSSWHLLLGHWLTTHNFRSHWHLLLLSLSFFSLSHKYQNLWLLCLFPSAEMSMFAQAKPKGGSDSHSLLFKG